MATPKARLVTSFKEVRDAIKEGLVFPVIAIPFGADSTTPCRYFHSEDEISEEAVLTLLANSHYTPKEKVWAFHLIEWSTTEFSKPLDSTFYKCET